jgi:hypothetical protein
MADAVSDERPAWVSAKTELRELGHALRSGQSSSSTPRIVGALLGGVSGGGEVAFWIFMMNICSAV